MVLSRTFMRAKYTRNHLVGVALCLGGLGLTVMSDLAGQERTDDYPHALKGDVLCILGAAAYAGSNVMQENFVKNHDRVRIGEDMWRRSEGRGRAITLPLAFAREARGSGGSLVDYLDRYMAVAALYDICSSLVVSLPPGFHAQVLRSRTWPMGYAVSVTTFSSTAVLRFFRSQPRRLSLSRVPLRKKTFLNPRQV